MDPIAIILRRIEEHLHLLSFGSLQARANVILWVLILIGLVYALINWKKGVHGLVLASFLGVFASLSLVPPIDANDMRAFAATIPFTALWVVEGGYALISWGKKLLKQNEDSQHRGDQLFRCRDWQSVFRRCWSFWQSQRQSCCVHLAQTSNGSHPFAGTDCLRARPTIASGIYAREYKY